MSNSVGRVKSLFTSCISIRDGWSASAAVDMSTSQKVCATHCNTLQHAATRCNTLHGFFQLQHVSKSKRVCNTLQHSATSCNTLQHPATPYNTLQHPATCCNTLHHPATTSHRRFCTKRDLFHYLTYPRHLNISEETCIHKHQTCKRDV